MLRLVARYADLWNADWTRRADELAPRLAAVDAACVAEGRDPATLGRSACVLLDLPGANGRGGQGPRTRNDAPRAPIADTAEAAAILREYADAGIEHLQVWLDPGTVAGIDAFAPVLAALQGVAVR